MYVIWKYELQIGYTILSLPIGAKILSVQAQHDKIVLWALMEMNAVSMNQHEFLVYGTGAAFGMGDGMQFLSTVQVGEFVWHVFKVKNENDL